MKKTIFILFIFMGLGSLLPAQQVPPEKTIRITDSLTSKEKADRNPVILRSELDSLVKLYAPLPAQPADNIPGKKDSRMVPVYMNWILSGLLLVSLVILLMFIRQGHWIRRFALNEAGPSSLKSTNGIKKLKKGQPGFKSGDPVEKMQDELTKLRKENEGLQGVIREYNGIQHEFESLRHSLQKTFKIRNYPGNGPGEKDDIAIHKVLDTEKAVADFAYEKFLKPILQLVDANKNSPARMSQTDRAQVIDKLISLSFLYIEYLYLRVPDLAVGGHMVERLKSVTGGAILKKELLKKLNMEAGSRALVMRMALDKVAVQNLSYPVFDETNLNKD